MTPEESKKMIEEWVAANPERGAEATRIAKENTQKFLDEREHLRTTNLDEYMKIINNEPKASRDPDLYFDKQLRDIVREEMRKDLLAKREADRAKMLAEKAAARKAGK